MRTIILDIQNFDNKADLYQYFKDQISLCFYHGANLEALYDDLTSITEATTLVLRYPAVPKEALLGYIPRMLKTFEDAARENYNLSLQLEEIS